MEATDSSLEHNQYLVRNKHSEDEVIDISSHDIEPANLPARREIDEAFNGVRAAIAAMKFCSVEARKEMLGSLDEARATAHHEFGKVQTMTQLHIPIAELQAEAERRYGPIGDAVRDTDDCDPAA